MPPRSGPIPPVDSITNFLTPHHLLPQVDSGSQTHINMIWRETSCSTTEHVALDSGTIVWHPQPN